MSESLSYKPFEELKTIARRREIAASGLQPKGFSCPKSLNNSTDDDALCFQEAMEHVREIKEYREIPFNQKKLQPIYQNTRSDDDALRTLELIVKGKEKIDLRNTQEYIYWYNPTVSVYLGLSIIEKLHGGGFAIQDYLDLHGFSVANAKELTRLYLKDCTMRGMRCVKIIHGRGLRSPRGPLIKDALQEWLTGICRKYIVAFVTARQVDGGAGATYVLLKRK
ncbi:MAG: Smr/MutS family protein [Candidatus Magnetoovum sp. WYHC-5]|nr:Smr/MutS family protein [Candidatus Magnetoovum sp. WYHC-5]